MFKSEKMNDPKINMVEPPEGVSGEGFFATKLSDVVGMARANSLWPLPFATSCCGIEFMATMASHYDLARFGSERVSFSPRQADMLLVMGTIAKKMAPILRQVYEQMSEPRWVIAVGACACSGGIFDTYSVLQGIDKDHSGRRLRSGLSAKTRADRRRRHEAPGFGQNRISKTKKLTGIPGIAGFI
jgi:NADH-quinone oxidoreductase subunit B